MRNLPVRQSNSTVAQPAECTPSFCAEFGCRFGRPKRFGMAGKRRVVACDAAVVVDKIQPPSVCLFADGRVAWGTMGFHCLVGSQGGNGYAAVDDGGGSHGDAVKWRA